jgi:hypothetical protein
MKTYTLLIKFSFLSPCHTAKMYVNFIIQTTYMQRCQIYLHLILPDLRM